MSDRKHAIEELKNFTTQLESLDNRVRVLDEQVTNMKKIMDKIDNAMEGEANNDNDQSSPIDEVVNRLKHIEAQLDRLNNQK